MHVLRNWKVSWTLWVLTVVEWIWVFVTFPQHNNNIFKVSTIFSQVRYILRQKYQMLLYYCQNKYVIFLFYTYQILANPGQKQQKKIYREEKKIIVIKSDISQFAYLHCFAKSYLLLWRFPINQFQLQLIKICKLSLLTTFQFAYQDFAPIWLQNHYKVIY